MNYLLLLPLALFSCSDYPASEGNDSEANPIDEQGNLINVVWPTAPSDL